MDLQRRRKVMLKDKSLLQDSDLFEELDNEKAATLVGGQSLNPANLLNLMTDAGATWDTWSVDAYQLAINHSILMCNESGSHHKGFGDRFNTLDANVMAENVAYAATDQEAFNLWINSPDHKANMLNPAHKNVGVGIWQCPDGYNYYTAIFYS